MRLAHALILAVVTMLATGGCTSERDFVLQKPIEVLAPDSAHIVTLPAGTRVTQTGYHDGMAFIKVQGLTRIENLELAPVAK